MSDLVSLEPERLQSLAAEVALQYHPPDELAAQYEVSESYLEQLLSDSQFQAMVASARREIDETGEQVRLVARRMVSQLVPEMATIVTGTRNSPRDRIDAFKALTAVAGVAKEQEQRQQAFAIQINL